MARAWFESLRLPLVRETAGSRVYELATTSALRHLSAPSFDGTAVRSVLLEQGSMGESMAYEVALRQADDAPLTGECSHCRMTFGPCVHVTTLLVDIAGCRALRDALVERRPTEAAALEALSMRRAHAAEKRFSGTLQKWLGPDGEPQRIQIAATPSFESSSYGRPYGEAFEPEAAAVLTVSVRLPGERRLLSAQDVARSEFRAKDRRVLEHVQQRGLGRKTLEARGVRASLAIEAMREHGGIFGPAFKGLLPFRIGVARPMLELGKLRDAIPGERSLESLVVAWDAGGRRFDMRDVFFFPGPFPYVWVKSAGLFRVAPDVDLELATSLARTPELVLPPGRREDAGGRVLRAMRGRGVLLPAPETFGLLPIETPRIVLRLAGEPLRVEGALIAVYKSREVSLPDPSAPEFDGRDFESEERALQRVKEAGLWLEAPVLEGDASIDECEPVIGAIDDGAIALWQHGLPALRASDNPPIEIELSKRLADVKVGMPIMAKVFITLEGDWLKTKLEFSAREIPVELAAIREALRRKERWVVLDDGTLAKITDEVEELAIESEGVLDERGKGKLAPHQLGRLDRWLEENDGRVDAAVERMRTRLRALAVAAEPKMPDGLRATLRPYQRHGLAWLQFLEQLGAGGILADDMGLGKTITTLAFLLGQKQAKGPAPTLVVCPTSVATNWVREAERFTPDLRVLLLHGPSPTARQSSRIDRHDVVITTYALLRRDLETLAKVHFRAIVLDEAQYVKNADSQTRRAAGKLDAEMRLALTGTPVENRLKELWSIASFVNPGLLGSERSFELRFERPIAIDPKSPRAAELRAAMRPFLLRRTKDQVLTDLPPKTEVERLVELAPADQKLYDALALTLREKIAQAMEKTPGASQLNVFTALTRLRQMACEPRLIDPRLPASRSCKREVFLDLVRELVAEGRRALVFSQFVELLTLWRADLDAEGIAYEYLDGGTQHRSEVVDRFQNGTAPLFLISLKAGGFGLNLTAADTVIHCDPWWNPAVEDQATDRAYRIGQDKPVTVVRLIASGTIEEKILSLKAKKRTLTQAVIQNDAAALRGIAEEELFELLGGFAAPAPDAPKLGRGAPTDLFATEDEVLRPEYKKLVAEARLWLETTGGFEAELATKVGIPVPFASRLARGEPFPCSRATAQRIFTRLREW